MALTGWSRAKLLSDIKGRYLEAKADPASGIWVIEWQEAQRYLRAIGLLR